MEPWQILDVGSIWMKEFASALSRRQPVVAWQPRMLSNAFFQQWEKPRHLADPPLNIVDYPLQRGYARPVLRALYPFARRVVSHLRAHCADPARTPLLCTTPFYAPVAERWPGPVVYYSTDLTSAYDGLNAAQVNALERRMCRVAALVCPNSQRIARHLQQVAECEPGKLVIIPNATRQSNLAAQASDQPGALPADVQHLPRPIVGVLGDLAANMDWLLLAESIRHAPGLTWLFVGPYHRPIAEAPQREAREWCRAHANFIGARPYGELQAYARALDAAVLPYRKKEPTYSGSSTRFYEHLAALRPMVATRGFAELLEKEPLLQLIDTPAELCLALDALAIRGFRDGHEHARWQAGRHGTWEQRADDLIAALAARFTP